MLSVERLTIDFGPRRVVDELSFALQRGRTLCIAGESGSGKSLTSLAIMGLLPRAASVPGGAIIFEGRDLLGLPERQLQPLRGKRLGMIFQEPMTSLNPLMTVGQQLEETLRRHEPLGRREIARRAREMLDAVRMPHAEKRLAQYPHELSGGMRQRVMIAMAMLCRPDVLIADEPTTALDVTIQAQILELMRELQQSFGTGLLLITHDMGVVAEMADEVVVMNQGRMEERAPVRQLFAAPAAAYTRKLLAAVPVLGSAASEALGERPPLLEVNDLCVRFPVRGGWLEPVRNVHAVEHVSFTLRQGETLGLVGESGCGKSTTGKALMNMLAYQGSVKLDGRELNGLQGEALQAVRRDVQMIFQDPYAALNPRKTVLELVGEPLLIHDRLPLAERRERVAALLRGRRPGRRRHDPLPAPVLRRPAPAPLHRPRAVAQPEADHRRRIGLGAGRLGAGAGAGTARAAARDAWSELPVHLSRPGGGRAHLSPGGGDVWRKIVEIGRRDQVLHNPRHPYTRRLLEAVPMPDVDRRRDFKALLEAFEAPDPIKPQGFRAPPQRFDAVGEDHLVAV